MQAQHNSPAVPNAHGGPISDRTLELMATFPDRILDGDGINSAEFALLLQNLGPALHELLHRRRAMAVIEDLTDMNNVVFLPAAE